MMGCILVVDDQEQNRDMLSRRLAKQGFETRQAESGQEALEVIAAEQIDLVLLDIRMPGMDGNEVLEKIRRQFSPTELPVIMVTAETDSDSEVRSIGLGADDYVTKPIDFKILLARLNHKLAISKSVKERLQTIKTPVESVLNEASILALIARGESSKLEFKSTLRWNIHSGAIGKEIETAWLKTIVAFLNSEGGALLVGVKDDGSIHGLSDDKFKTDDKLMLYVTSCLKENIGSEYIGSIFYDLVSVGDQQVLYFKCSAVSEPVFLKQGNTEEFYARFGPSSGKLNTKEVIAYLKNRK